MKKFAGLMTIVLVAALFMPVAASALVADDPQYSTIRSEHVAAFREDHRDMIFLDVRSADAFALAHIEGAINLPLRDPNFVRKLKKLDSSRTILIYADLAPPSRETIHQIAEAGFTSVIYLSDGFRGWQRNNLPTEKGADTSQTFERSRWD